MILKPRPFYMNKILLDLHFSEQRALMNSIPHNKMYLLVNCEFIMKLIFVEVKYQATILFG